VADPSRGATTTLGGCMKYTTTPLIKCPLHSRWRKGSLAMYESRSGEHIPVLMLDWEASLDWVEVLFSHNNTKQWVRTEALELVNESR